MASDLSNEDKQKFLVQKTIGFILSSLALIVCIINFTYALSGNSLLESLMRSPVIVLFIAAMVTLVTGLINNNIARVVQVLVGYFAGSLAILEQYDAIFGIGLYILFSIIAFKYGFFKEFPRLKILVGIIAVYTLTIISLKHTEGKTQITAGLGSLLYVTIFLVVMYVIYSNDIKGYITKARAAETTVSQLIAQRRALENRLRKLNREIESLMHDNEIIDFDACGITERERDVLYALVVYKDTGKEIAERLEIGHETVKTHLKHIRNKLGVDRRDEIIELCRNNFIKEGNNI